jgi:hypothetical protein
MLSLSITVYSCGVSLSKVSLSPFLWSSHIYTAAVYGLLWLSISRLRDKLFSGLGGNTQEPLFYPLSMLVWSVAYINRNTMLIGCTDR